MQPGGKIFFSYAMRNLLVMVSPSLTTLFHALRRTSLVMNGRKAQSGKIVSNLVGGWTSNMRLNRERVGGLISEFFAILIEDNFGSHLSYQVLQRCNEITFKFIAPSPHATHLLQPLVVEVFWKKAKSTKQVEIKSRR